MGSVDDSMSQNSILRSISLRMWNRILGSVCLGMKKIIFFIGSTWFCLYQRILLCTSRDAAEDSGKGLLQGLTKNSVIQDSGIHL